MTKIGRRPVNKEKFKRGLCRAFNSARGCTWKGDCKFLHEKAGFMKYPCKIFAKDGNCVYGKYCKYVHDEKKETSNTNVAANTDGEDEEIEELQDVDQDSTGSTHDGN